MAAAKARKDPPRRTRDPRKLRVVNGNPDYHYVLVKKNGDEFAQDFYESLGYTPVNDEENGPHLSIARPSQRRRGHPISYVDTVLMCIHKDEKAAIDEYGLDGESGMSTADDIQKLIRERGDPSGGGANRTAGLEMVSEVGPQRSMTILQE
jgi:hypothetical protein